MLKAIYERKSDSIKNVVYTLLEQDDNSYPNGTKLLQEIGVRHYSKPSDWMFAEMKVKELEKYLSDTISIFNK